MAINVKDKLVTVESLGIAYSTEQGARQEADQALSTRIDNIVAPEGDPSLTEVSDARVSGQTIYNTLKARLDADQAAVGTEISAINESLCDLSYKAAQSGLSDMVKQALLACFNNVAWDNNNGQNYYDALESALYPQGDLEVIFISARYTQSANVYPDTGLESLKDDLVVKAHYDNSSTQILHKNLYSLSGTLTSGTSTITVTYDGKTTTFNVNVTTWDSYNYSISNGQIVKVTGSTFVISSRKNDIQLDSADSTRRSFPTTRGVRPFSDRRNNYAPLGYYPIPIPDDAIGAVVTITPATQYHGAVFYTYTDSGGYVKLEGLGLGWVQGSRDYVFANLSTEDIKFITVASKYDSSGGLYSEEPSELTVEFYKE